MNDDPRDFEQFMKRRETPQGVAPVQAARLPFSKLSLKSGLLRQAAALATVTSSTY